MGRAAGPGRRGRLHRRQRLLERHGGGKRKDPSGAQADTLLPEAYAVEGVLTGPLVVTGFAVSLALSAI